jgi:amino acid transporter
MRSGTGTFGYAYFGTFFSGEIKKSSRNIPLGIVSALLITDFFIILTVAICVQVMGYIGNNNPIP